MPPPAISFPVIGIGASAGGLDAVTRLVKGLPAELGKALVFIQHMDPAHASLMPGLLARATQLPIVEATDRMPIVINHFYVAPSNADLTIRDGKLHLTPRAGESGPHLPIDAFFESLAEECQAASIAVVLSGTGSDGTGGVAAIRSAGGIVFAQDEESSQFPDMPRNARQSGCVDFSLAPEQIAMELARIDLHPDLLLRPDASPKVAPSIESGAAFAEIRQLLSDLSGVDLHLYSGPTILRRVHRRMALGTHADIDGYLQHLREKKTELEALAEDVFIHTTSFFRDPESILALQHGALRDILNQQQEPNSLRIWCAGCSTGEEVYSIAMLVLEELGQDAPNAGIKIIGTDVSEQAVRQARTGIYSQSSVDDVTPDRLQRFFVRVAGGYQIAKFVRELCLFAAHDVTKDPPFSKLDLVVCRNVLIYMGPQLQMRVIEAFHYALNPSGYLMLGNSESLRVYANRFAELDTKNKIFKRKEFRTQDSRGVPRPETPVDESRSPQKTAPMAAFDLRREVEYLVLDRYGPAAIVVGPDLNILHFRGMTGPFLAPSSGVPGLNLFKMVRPELVAELRPNVRKVVASARATLIEGIELDVNGAVKFYDIRVAPLYGRHENAFDVVILFQETAAPQEVKKVLGERGSAESARIAKLERELISTRQELIRVITAQETAIAEMRAVNQDSSSVNEELQTANEELETAKEELQSSNEELISLNAELQTRNDELTELSTELNTVLSAVSLPIVMLSRDLLIERFTPQAGQIFNVIPSDIGRPFTHLASTLSTINWDKVVNEVTKEHRVVEQEVQDRDGFWYRLHVSPHLQQGSEEAGLLVALFDIQAAKMGQEQANQARDQAQAAELAKSEFLSAMSHEIRTPMNGVIGMTSLLQDTELAADQRAFVTTIQTSANALLEIIDDILDFSKGEEKKLESEAVPFDLNTLMEDVASLLSLKYLEKSVPVVVCYPRELPNRFLGDPRKIRQILINLTGNAIKFTEAGYVLLEAACSGTNDAGHGEITISVHDTGIGIAPDTLPRLFQRFTQADSSTTRKYGGSGLGLAICKQLAETMGGVIDATSILGEGSSFFVRLPLACDPNPAIPVEDPASALDGVRCLLIAPNPVSRLAVSGQCKGWGIRVTEAGSHSEALLAIDELIDEGASPIEIVILDYPIHEVAGIAAMRSIRSVRGLAKLPLIVLKYPGQQTSLTQRTARRNERHVLKPVRSRELLATLRELLPAAASDASEGDAAPLAVATPARSADPDSRQEGLNILVAEDNLINQKVIMALLAKLGHHSELAANGVEAVQMMVESECDLILMDCQMPEMDGFEATARIGKSVAKRNRRVPVIALTAGVLDADREKCLAAGMDDFLGKPINLETLHQMIEKWRPAAG